MKINIKLQNIFVYGIAHAIVDFTCISLVLHLNYLHQLPVEKFGLLILSYNFLAFALQSPLSWLVDSIARPVPFAVTGILLVVLSVFFRNDPWVTVILAGLGNASFHLGGAVICLSLKPGKATYPGIYVAPGALGVFMGTIVGRSNFPGTWIFIIPLLILGFLIIIVKKPKLIYYQRLGNKTSYLELIVILVLLTIVIRGLFGFVSFFPWKTGILMVGLATMSVFLGKMAGGYIADKYGWMKVSIFSLSISAIIFIFFPHVWFIALLGILLFNFSMPVTLTAVSNILPGNPAFSFGLTTLALFIGMLPTFMTKIDSKFLICSLIIVSIISLYFGLKLYLHSNRNEASDNQ